MLTTWQTPKIFTDDKTLLYSRLYPNKVYFCISPHRTQTKTMLVLKWKILLNQRSTSTVCMHTRTHTKMHLKEAVPVISNHTGTSEDSVATTPTMCATGSLSMTEKVKGDSSKTRGAASVGNSGLGIHSICRRQVEDFWGRPLSTALIWEWGGEQKNVSNNVMQHFVSSEFMHNPLVDPLPETL